LKSSFSEPPNRFSLPRSSPVGTSSALYCDALLVCDILILIWLLAAPKGAMSRYPRHRGDHSAALLHRVLRLIISCRREPWAPGSGAANRGIVWNPRRIGSRVGSGLAPDQWGSYGRAHPAPARVLDLFPRKKGRPVKRL